MPGKFRKWCSARYRADALCDIPARRKGGIIAGANTRSEYKEKAWLRTKPNLV
jgi:hypothetical protein